MSLKDGPRKADTYRAARRNFGKEQRMMWPGIKPEKKLYRPPLQYFWSKRGELHCQDSKHARSYRFTHVGEQ